MGCVPKKLMTYGAHYAHDMHDAENFGWEVSIESLSRRRTGLGRWPGEAGSRARVPPARRWHAAETALTVAPRQQ